MAIGDWRLAIGDWRLATTPAVQPTQSQRKNVGREHVSHTQTTDRQRALISLNQNYPSILPKNQIEKNSSKSNLIVHQPSIVGSK